MPRNLLFTLLLTVTLFSTLHTFDLVLDCFSQLEGQTRVHDVMVKQTNKDALDDARIFDLVLSNEPELMHISDQNRDFCCVFQLDATGVDGYTIEVNDPDDDSVTPASVDGPGVLTLIVALRQDGKNPVDCSFDGLANWPKYVTDRDQLLYVPSQASKKNGMPAEQAMYYHYPRSYDKSYTESKDPNLEDDEQQELEVFKTAGPLSCRIKKMTDQDVQIYTENEMHGALNTVVSFNREELKKHHDPIEDMLLIR